jgi:hypothetical protein
MAKSETRSYPCFWLGRSGVGTATMVSVLSGMEATSDFGTRNQISYAPRSTWPLREARSFEGSRARPSCARPLLSAVDARPPGRVLDDEATELDLGTEPVGSGEVPPGAGGVAFTHQGGDLGGQLTNR